jgi:hypothetical protein
MVPKLKDMSHIIEKMHNKIGRFGKARTFFEIKQWFSSMIEYTLSKNLSKLVTNEQTDNLESGIEGMKSILVYDLFYHVTLDIVGPYLRHLLATNMYLLLLTTILSGVKRVL